MIRLIKSTFYKEHQTKKALNRFIRDARQLSMGEQCARFEKEFATWQGRKYCVMFNSGSSANLALIQSLINMRKLRRGSSVGFSAVTWSTNVMPLLQLGLKPVPIEISLDTLNISPQTLKAAYREQKFSCLFLTNLLGYCDNLPAIRSFCKKNKILLIEDNCEALGSEYGVLKLGNFGYASTFSFFVGHHLSTIEGGAVCTDDREINNMLRLVRSHGWDRHLPARDRNALRKRHAVDPFYGMYTFYDLAYNLRPTEIQGFVGLTQLKYLDKMISVREKNYKMLERIYHNEDFVPIHHTMSTHSNFAFPLVCKTAALKKHYVRKAKQAGIEIRPVIGGDITKQPFFKKTKSGAKKRANAHLVHTLGFYFGNNPEMTRKELHFLVKTFSQR